MGEIATTQGTISDSGHLTVAKALEERRHDLVALLPEHVSPDRFFRILNSEVKANPDLRSCTAQSLFTCAVEAARLGLDVGSGAKQIHFVPFNTKKKQPRGYRGPDEWEMVAQPIIDYRGLVKLGLTNGDLRDCWARLVYEADTYTEEERDGQTHVTHLYDPFLPDDKRGKIRGVYARVERNNGAVRYVPMSVADVERVRNNANSSNSPAWRNHWGEMAKKTAIRNALKLVDMSPEARRFMTLADGTEFSYGDAQPRSVDVSAQPSVVARFAAPPRQIAQATDSEPDATDEREPVMVEVDTSDFSDDELPGGAA